MKKFIRAFATIVATMVLLLGLPIAAQAMSPQNMSYIIVPHPDDEWETWSLVESSPANYKVFITMTHGDETGYCVEGKAYPGSHDDPNPMPRGKWTPECSDARLNSWSKFFTNMSTKDPTVPGDWSSYKTVGPFPTNGVNIARIDDGRAIQDTTARVWIDAQGRGAAIAFNLGDGDLTPAEVDWAYKTVRDNRAAFGLDTELPNYNVIGAFSNKYYANCATYLHNDHYSVHNAMFYAKDWGVEYRAAATCKTDPDAYRYDMVDALAQTAWQYPNGAFYASYGWLGPYRLSQDQSSIFHASQVFWVRRG